MENRGVKPSALNNEKPSKGDSGDKKLPTEGAPSPRLSFSDYYDAKVKPHIESGKVDRRVADVVKRVWDSDRWNQRSWTALREGD